MPKTARESSFGIPVETTHHKSKGPASCKEACFVEKTTARPVVTGAMQMTFTSVQFLSSGPSHTEFTQLSNHDCDQSPRAHDVALFPVDVFPAPRENGQIPGKIPTESHLFPKKNLKPWMVPIRQPTRKPRQSGLSYGLPSLHIAFGSPACFKRPRWPNHALFRSGEQDGQPIST